jgi:hypothetical protein
VELQMIARILERREDGTPVLEVFRDLDDVQLSEGDEFVTLKVTDEGYLALYP